MGGVATSRRDFTLFLHTTASDYLVSGIHNNNKLFQGTLQVKITNSGARPFKFRVQGKTKEQVRRPEDFIDLGRKAHKIRISNQTPLSKQNEIKELFRSYGLKSDVVRTCQYCSKKGNFSPLVDSNAIAAHAGEICIPCALLELQDEYSQKGQWTTSTKNHLKKILIELQNIDLAKNALEGELNPILTEFDQIPSITLPNETIQIKDLDISPELKYSLSKRFDTLQPIQIISINNGLLDGDDQLVVSATGSGKTLIGELAGIDRCLKGKGKFLFLVPLVALANQKHDSFHKNYGDLLKVSLRVGSSRVRGISHPFDPNADVIVGTYEGIDHALRTKKDFSQIGTIVIDEVHMISDKDRGHGLDGLIARLKSYCDVQSASRTSHKTQWIYLSATIGNPTQIGNSLKAKTILFSNRTIPLHRHIAFSMSGQKHQMIEDLSNRESLIKSSKGYGGQTIVFTHSRQRCHDISNKLTCPSAPYHAGLGYPKRKKIEERFAEGKISTVVTTAALAAGVDFPASQVIFDSLAMGIKWITAQEFQQMQGRAGRPSYHDRGLIYILIEPGKTYDRHSEKTEDEVAFDLLKSDAEDVSPWYEDQANMSETLANVIVSPTNPGQLNSSMIGKISTNMAMKKLTEMGLLKDNKATPIGEIISQNFFTPKEAITLIKHIKTGTSPFGIVAEIEILKEDS